MLRCSQRVLQRHTRSSTPLKGFSSSPKAREEEEYPFRIPPERLRALISLYHQSSKFITPETLEARIDEAFTNVINVGTQGTTLYTYEQLTSELESLRKGKGRSTLSSYNGTPLDYRVNASWSEQIARESTVGAALWGVQENGRPGLETVLETSVLNEKEKRLLRETNAEAKPVLRETKKTGEGAI
ncbi:hypothetical protein M422DRAFT_22695 [Sphaerobolus stellatus SS14]|nr:hypothetical protein M422DRAFT_22695 [Sphaerobolus stellatus SS14]